MVSVVLFDLDDTLFAHRHAVAAGVAAHRKSLGGVVAAADPAVELERWYALEEHHYHRYLGGEVDFLGQRRDRARAFVEPFGITLADDATADAWFNGYILEYQRAWQLHDDTLPCLDVLQTAGVRLGIITNGELRFQLAKIEALGLASRFDHVIASGDFGYPKPDARIFAHACSLFAVLPADAAYVGDRLRTDAIGAAAAGLTGVWIDRAASATETDAAAASTAGASIITGLAQLPHALAAT